MWQSCSVLHLGRAMAIEALLCLKAVAICHHINLQIVDCRCICEAIARERVRLSELFRDNCCLLSCSKTTSVQRQLLCECINMSLKGFQLYPRCGSEVPVAKKRCVSGCNFQKQHGRPKGTTRGEGYGTTGGRPVGTTGGRPVSTTGENGFATSGGRPVGATVEKGFCAGTSGGRPVGTTVEKGFCVGTSGGRPSDKKVDERIDFLELVCPMNGTHLRIALT